MRCAFDEVVQTIGLEAACHLTAGWGNSRVYVPTAPDPTHPLALRIGFTPAVALAKEFGGILLEVPSEYNALRTTREHKVIADRRKGATIGELSRRYGFGHRSIKNILKKHHTT